MYACATACARRGPSDDAHVLSSDYGRSRALRHLISLNQIITRPSEKTQCEWKQWEGLDSGEAGNKRQQGQGMGNERGIVID